MHSSTELTATRSPNRFVRPAGWTTYVWGFMWPPLVASITATEARTWPLACRRAGDPFALVLVEGLLEPYVLRRNDGFKPYCRDARARPRRPGRPPARGRGAAACGGRSRCDSWQ